MDTQFNEAKRRIISSGIDIVISDHEEASGNWHIYLGFFHKVRLAWKNNEHVLSVEKEMESRVNASAGWEKIFVSHIDDENEMFDILDEILKSE